MTHSLDTVEGIGQFVEELVEQGNVRVLMAGLQTAALALRPLCDPDDFRLIVPAEALTLIQNLPPLVMEEFPDELHAMLADKGNALAIMQQLRATTLQEVLKALGFYVPCSCGVQEPHDPFTEGVCGLNAQVEMAFAVSGNAPDQIIELAPEDDDESVPAQPL